MLAPTSLMGPMNPDWLTKGVAQSTMNAKYGAEVDRESAYEILSARVQAATAEAAQQAQAAAAAKAAPKASTTRTPKAAEPKSIVEEITENTMVRQMARSAASQLTRSIFGTLMKGR